MAKSLKERTQEFSFLSPLMEGKNKSELSELIGKIVTITNFDFITDSSKQSDYVIFTVAETPEFYFGGQVLTDQLKQLDEEGYRGEIITNGLPTLFGTKRSNKKNPVTGIYNNYTTVEFYPEVKK